MRVLGSILVPAIGVAFVSGVWAQGVPASPADERIPPYHTHRDGHRGHNHVYPDRGAILREVPRGALSVHYAGMSYRFADGVWFEQRGPAFEVVEPPIGLLVPTLPSFTTLVLLRGETYLYANDVYYRPRPDLGGYEVVNDPEDLPASAEAVPTVASQGPAAAATDAATDADEAPAVPAPLAAASASPAAVVSDSAPPAAPAAAPPPAAPPAMASPAAAVPASGPAAVPPVPGAPGAAMTSVPTGASQVGVTRVIAYPRNGQSSEQQARDHYDCYRFAVAQSGFDPLRTRADPSSPQAAQGLSDYQRAQAACFDGRGYSIR